MIRGLIEEVRLVPEEGRLRIELSGELAALISLAAAERPTNISSKRRSACTAR
jgi:hypothetical protein